MSSRARTRTSDDPTAGFRRLLTGFRSEHAELWGRHPVCIDHTLHDTGLFADETLAELLEDYPRDNYDLLHMAEQGTGNLATWREGDLGEARGAAALRAIHEGRMWLNLRRVHETSGAHAALLHEIFAELAALMPGLSAFKLNLGILVSSPGAQVYYHADVPGQSLWQIRGRKRVYVYPNRAPFLPEDQIERVVLSMSEAEIAYEPWFDDYATVFELEPGQMLHWPVNCPHRVENLDGVNVSVTTEHWTPGIRSLYASRYANGLLRHRLGLRPPPPPTAGPGMWARMALAGVVKSAGLNHEHRHQRWVDWALAPDEPSRMRDIEPFLLNP